MGRRNAGHGFMPGKWVFPGGRIARCDYHAPAASEPTLGIACSITADVTNHRLRALAATAVRETFEETGLRLAAATDSHSIPGSWKGFCETGVAPALGELTLIARMITPPHRPKRFDTLFFIANAKALVSEAPVDTRELEDVAWFAMDDTEKLDLPRPTRIILGELRARFAGEDRPPFFRRFRNAQE